MKFSFVPQCAAGVVSLGRFDKADIRAALILGSIAAAAGIGRWFMDGSHADAAHLLSALQHPLERIHSPASWLFVGGIVALGYFIWWLLLGRRRGRRGTLTQASQNGGDANR
jgi:hypothetical protein